MIQIHAPALRRAALLALVASTLLSQVPPAVAQGAEPAGTVKTLIDRFYVFFNPTKPPRTFKPKKLGTVLTFGAGPAEAYEKVAEAAAATFGVVGVTEHKNLLFGNQNDRKALAGDAARQQQLRELADYLAK